MVGVLSTVNVDVEFLEVNPDMFLLATRGRLIFLQLGVHDLFCEVSIEYSNDIPSPSEPLLDYGGGYAVSVGLQDVDVSVLLFPGDP